MLLTRSIVCILAAAFGYAEASRTPRRTKVTVVSLDKALAATGSRCKNGNRAVKAMLDSIERPEHAANSFESNVDSSSEIKDDTPVTESEIDSKDSMEMKKDHSAAILPTTPKDEVPENSIEPTEDKKDAGTVESFIDHTKDKKVVEASQIGSEYHSGENASKSASSSVESVPPPTSIVQPKRFKCDATGVKTLASKGILRIKDTRTITKVIITAALVGVPTCVCYCAGIVDGSLVIDFAKPMTDGIAAAGTRVCGHMISNTWPLVSPMIRGLTHTVVGYCPP